MQDKIDLFRQIGDLFVTPHREKKDGRSIADSPKATTMTIATASHPKACARDRKRDQGPQAARWPAGVRSDCEKRGSRRFSAYQAPTFVAEPAHRLDKRGQAGSFDLLAQALDETLRELSDTYSPAVSQMASRSASRVTSFPAFGRNGEGDGTLARTDAPRRRLSPPAPTRCRCSHRRASARLTPPPAKGNPHARQQLTGPERLGDVVDGAHVKPPPWSTHRLKP